MVCNNEARGGGTNGWKIEEGGWQGGELGVEIF